MSSQDLNNQDINKTDLKTLGSLSWSEPVSARLQYRFGRFWLMRYFLFLTSFSLLVLAGICFLPFDHVWIKQILLPYVGAGLLVLILGLVLGISFVKGDRYVLDENGIRRFSKNNLLFFYFTQNVTDKIPLESLITCQFVSQKYLDVPYSAIVIQKFYTDDTISFFSKGYDYKTLYQNMKSLSISVEKINSLPRKTIQSRARFGRRVLLPWVFLLVTGAFFCFAFQHFYKNTEHISPMEETYSLMSVDHTEIFQNDF